MYPDVKVLVTGANGQLGKDLTRELLNRHIPFVLTDIQEKSMYYTPERVEYFQLDITDEPRLVQCFNGANPDVIIHCAAWTDVETAEDYASSPYKNKIYELNVSATEHVARWSGNNDKELIYISTDYVYNDLKEENPLNYYGTTKLLGEYAAHYLCQKCSVVRIAGLFSPDINAKNFFRKIAEKLTDGKTAEVDVNAEEFLRPTYAPHLARLLVDMCLREEYDVYDVTNTGDMASRCDLACFLAEELYREGIFLSGRVKPSFFTKMKARRPRKTDLRANKLRQHGFEPLPDWKYAIHDYVKQYKNQLDKQ